MLKIEMRDCNSPFTGFGGRIGKGSTHELGADEVGGLPLGPGGSGPRTRCDGCGNDLLDHTGREDGLENPHPQNHRETARPFVMDPCSHVYAINQDSEKEAR